MLYLAMTAGEMERCAQPPANIAWMSCRFSSRDHGLSNCPKDLPDDSVIIVDDQVPISGHDPCAVAQQLRELIDKFHANAVLLDLQRPGGQEMAKHLVNDLPVPTAVSEQYADGLACPVFLSPRPLCRSLKDIAAPWKGRELWLDLPVANQTVTVTEKGAAVSPFEPFEPLADAHVHAELSVQYKIKKEQDRVLFTLSRGPQQLEQLVQQGEMYGISRFFCLFQEYSEKTS